MGSTATDHAVLEPYTTRLPPNEAEVLYQRARQGNATPVDERRFTGHLLMEMARLSRADGLAIQIHAGDSRAISLRRWTVKRDRKSTRLNSSHSQISYAVLCLKKNNTTTQ